MISVSQLRAAPHQTGGRIDLSWRNPAMSEFSGDFKFAGVCIVRRTRAFPINDGDGDVIYNSPPQGPFVSRYSDRGVSPLETYYYTVFVRERNAGGEERITHTLQSHASAFATRDYGLYERLYRMLPAVHQQQDTRLASEATSGLPPEALAALDELPAGLGNAGQLRRFFHATGSMLDLIRSMAEGLPQLRDVDRVRSDYLFGLSHWIGWQLDQTLRVDEKRNEVHFAPQFHRTLGTVPNLRSIVERYIRWQTQVTEYHQHLLRSNAPPAGNVFAAVLRPAESEGLADAASALGFHAKNHQHQGHELPQPSPATLLSGVGPFTIRPDMELVVRVDQRASTHVRFCRRDFLDMSAATPAEIARVLNRTLSGARARHFVDSNGDARFELTTHATGEFASLLVVRSAATLITLESAPHGAMSAVQSASGDVHLFYHATDPLRVGTTHAARQSIRKTVTKLTSDETAGDATNRSSRVRCKTFRHGRWGASFPVSTGAAPQSEPAATLMQDDRVFVAWIEQAHTAQSRIQFQLQNQPLDAAQPARLPGRQRGPFAVSPNSRLILHGNWAGPDGIEFQETDFAVPAAALAEEVRIAINTRMRFVQASVVDGTVQLETMSVGEDQWLQLDLQSSSAAETLGFDASNCAARGGWEDRLRWREPQSVPIPSGRYSDLAAVVDHQGRLRLFWAGHQRHRWLLFNAAWDGNVWGPVETVADALGGNREPVAIRDAQDRIVLIWSQRQVDDRWVLRHRVLDPATQAWSPEQALGAGSAAVEGREPKATLLSDGSLRIFFRASADGGCNLWAGTLAADTTTLIDLAPLTQGPSADSAPTPLHVSDKETWLFFRSDRNVALSTVGNSSLPTPDNRVVQRASRLRRFPPPRDSYAVVDHGTLRRFAGSQTLRLDHAARLGMRHWWDDMNAYTPQNPDGKTRLADDDRYTRGTIGIFLTQRMPNAPTGRRMIERLRALLKQYLPIHTRAVVVFDQRDIEYVYKPTADIGESYADHHPDIDTYDGPEDAGTAARLPQWIVLLATTPGHVSGDPNRLESLRNRSLFPPPE